MIRDNIHRAARDGFDESFAPIEPAADDSTFQATDHEPGTHGKIEVLRQRLCDGVPLWHPGDNLRLSTPWLGERGRGFDGPAIREIQAEGNGIAIPTD